MIDFKISELVHRHIILDLSIRTLERDRRHLTDLKINRALELWMEQKVKELQNDLRSVKAELGKNGVKIQSENRVDKLITEYIIIERGQSFERRYMNIALKNWVDEEVKRLLNLPYRTTEDAHWANKKPLNE